MKAWVLGGIGALVLAGLSAGPARAQQTPVKPEETPAKAEKAEIPACADCHDQAKVFRANAHGRNRGGLTGDALCAGCHGDTAPQHAASGGDKALIRVVRGAEGSKVCLNCHGGSTERSSFRGGAHAQAAVDCLNCHSIHASDPKAPHLVVKAGTALCATCHDATAAFMKAKPFTHRLDRGGLTCASCHDPHGRAGNANVRTLRTGELKCLSCHAEKRGPFVFEHGANVAGDCLSCHEQHGSSNPKMLKRAQVHQLCLECHSTISSNTLGSQPPSFHNITLPRYRNCTTCHVAVHGSNRSPVLLK